MTPSAPSKSGLETISRNRIFNRVAEELQTLILTQLKPGDMLRAPHVRGPAAFAINLIICADSRPSIVLGASGCMYVANTSY